MDPSTAKTKYQEASALFAKRDFAGALALIDELLQAFPAKPELVRVRARILAAMDQQSTPARPAKKRSRKLLWLGAVVILILATAGIAWTALPSSSSTPNVAVQKPKPKPEPKPEPSAPLPAKENTKAPAQAADALPPEPHVPSDQFKNIAGRWAWFNGITVLVEPDGTFAVVEDGLVELPDVAARRVRFEWVTRDKPSLWTLSPDGASLTSAEARTADISAKRVTPASGPPEDPLVVSALEGTWHWTKNGALQGITDIRKDGVCILKSGKSGSIERAPAQANTFIFKWPWNNYIDTLTLTASGQRLEGQNQQGVQVSGTRVTDQTSTVKPDQEEPFTTAASSAKTLSKPVGTIPLKVLYAGILGIPRETEFTQFLKEHFAQVKTTTYDKYTPAAADGCDVVILDYTPEGGYKRPPDLRLPSNYSRPTVAIKGVGVPDNLKLRPG